MTAAATIPLAPVRARCPWKPTERDHLIFRMVKFHGETQAQMASLLEIDQSTVSRAISRYERWLAHQQPGEEGRLSHEERLRSQRWLTYERNEAILESCLRIAQEMERHVGEVSKSTTRRPAHSFVDQQEVFTQTASVDRTGVAARFYRLAYRINMDQLKLVEQEPLTPLAPLLAGDVEDEEEGTVKPQNGSSRAPSESGGPEDHGYLQPAPESVPERELAEQTGSALDAAMPLSAEPTAATSSPVTAASLDAEPAAPSPARTHKTHIRADGIKDVSRSQHRPCAVDWPSEKNVHEACSPQCGAVCCDAAAPPERGR